MSHHLVNDAVAHFTRAQVSYTTLKRRMADAGLSVYHHLSDADLLKQITTVCHLQENERNDGHRYVQIALMTRVGVRAPRHQILRVLKAYRASEEVLAMPQKA